LGGDDESPSERRACSHTAQRFRSADEVVHRGAFVELYLHELVLRLGATVDIDVGNDHDDDRRPDLLLTVGEIETFVEASAVAGADVHDAETKRHLDAIHDAVNAVNAPAFFVDVDVEEHGSSTHSSRAGRDVDRDITHALLGSKGYYYNKELGQVVGERQRDGVGPKGPTKHPPLGRPDACQPVPYGRVRR
jgi:hypothetical protein